MLEFKLLVMLLGGKCNDTRGRVSPHTGGHIDEALVFHLVVSFSLVRNS